MQEHEPPDQPGVRSDLLERLRALETPPSAGSLAELSYQRAREALERALEEARTIRLNAIEDARATRERETAAMMDSLRALRQSAETQIESLLRAAEIEAERIRQRAEQDARGALDTAAAEASQVRAEAAASRIAVEERAKDVARLESEFEDAIAEIARRLNIAPKPDQGWFRRSSGKT